MQRLNPRPRGRYVLVSTLKLVLVVVVKDAPTRLTFHPFLCACYWCLC